jgi:hypothetical protein
VSWPYVIAAIAGAFSVGVALGTLIMGRLCAASRALDLDHTYLSRSAQ